MKSSATKRTRSPEELEKWRKARAERYLDRKLRQVCVDCEAPLGPDDGVKCELCVGRDAVSKEARKGSPKYKRWRRKAMKRYRKNCRRRDVCMRCHVPRAKWPPFTPEQIARQRVEKPQLCPTCRAKETSRIVEMRKRRRAGIVSITTARRERSRRQEYQPIDELLASTRVRLLRGLARLGDWIDVSGLFDAIGVPDYDEGDSAERDRFTQLLSRLSREGKLVERRASMSPHRHGGEVYDYRITDTGRAELRALLERSKAS